MMKCVALVFSLLVAASATPSAFSIVSEGLGTCLTAYGTSSTKFSLAGCEVCNHSLLSQKWTFGTSVGENGNICSVAVGKCFVEEAYPLLGQAYNFLVLGPPYASATNMAFSYNSTSLALSKQGNCSLVIDSYVGMGPVYMYYNGGTSDCNHPGANQRWAFV
jgi:hypothetical protein